MSLRFGVNYTPRVGWFHSWLDFDIDAVRRDLADVAELGLDHIRIFPLWPILQPNRGLVRPAALDAVSAVVDVAAEHGLDVNVDALQGHLSSFDFLPAWLTTWHDRGMFTDAEAIEGQEALVRALGDTLAERPNVMGLTLGNELNQFAAAPHPHPHDADAHEAQAWLARMLRVARERSPGLVTHAAYDATWYDDRQPFLPSHAAELGDETIVHSWVFNGAAQLHGGLAPHSTRHAEYLAQLAAAWHRDPERGVWLQEVGVPLTVVDPDDAVAFLEATVRSSAGVAGLTAITWWCSHDVARSLLDFPAVEYDLGLIDEHGRVKPTGRAFGELARELRHAAPPARVADALLLDDLALPRAACAPGGSFFEAWMAAADAAGKGPQIVVRSRADDAALTRARGIERVTMARLEGTGAALHAGGGAAQTMTP